jgi:hypothetical protein
MNLDTLRERSTKCLTVGGDLWRLRKMSAADGIAYSVLVDSMPKKEDGTLRHDSDAVACFAVALSKSVVGEAGVKELDSDEGRDLIGRLPIEDLTTLAEACLNWNGIDDSKKNEPLAN